MKILELEQLSPKDSATIDRTKPYVIKGAEYHSSWSVNSLDELFSKFKNEKYDVFKTDEKEFNTNSLVPSKISIDEYKDYVFENGDRDFKMYMSQNPTSRLDLVDEQYVHNWEEPESYFWLGKPGATAPLHFDLGDNFNFLLYGKKRWTIIHPDAIKRENKRMVFHCHQVSDPLQDVDYEAFPYFKDAQCYQFTQEQGDTLYIPWGWWHFVETLDLSFAINHWEKIPFHRIPHDLSKMVRKKISYKVGGILGK